MVFTKYYVEIGYLLNMYKLESQTFISEVNYYYYLCIEMPQEPIFIDVPVNKYARSQSQPRHISTSVVQSVKSKTNPLKTGSAYSVAASSSPKYHQRKISESFHLFNNTNQGNSVQLKSQSVE